MVVLSLWRLQCGFGCVPAQLCAQSLCDQAGQLAFWLLMC